MSRVDGSTEDKVLFAFILGQSTTAISRPPWGKMLREMPESPTAHLCTSGVYMQRELPPDYRSANILCCPPVGSAAASRVFAIQAATTWRRSRNLNVRTTGSAPFFSSTRAAGKPRGMAA